MTVTAEYRKILNAELPHAIHNERDYELALTRIETLMDKERKSAAELRYLDLLATLVEAYEDRVHLIEPADPIDTLRELMLARDMKQSELAQVLGSSGVTSEILSRKRALSKTQIGKLAAFFHVSPAVFLPAVAH